jgi:hypothetical protein
MHMEAKKNCSTTSQRAAVLHQACTGSIFTSGKTRKQNLHGRYLRPYTNGCEHTSGTCKRNAPQISRLRSHTVSQSANPPPPEVYLQWATLINPFPALVASEATRILRPIPTAPVTTARRSKAPRGGVWVLSRGPQASLGQSRRSARALAVAVKVV